MNMEWNCIRIHKWELFQLVLFICHWKPANAMTLATTVNSVCNRCTHTHTQKADTWIFRYALMIFFLEFDSFPPDTFFCLFQIGKGSATGKIVAIVRGFLLFSAVYHRQQPKGSLSLFASFRWFLGRIDRRCPFALLLSKHDLNPSCSCWQLNFPIGAAKVLKEETTSMTLMLFVCVCVRVCV